MVIPADLPGRVPVERAVRDGAEGTGVHAPWSARGEGCADARARSARDLLAMEQAEFSAAFRESPMKRARGSRPAGKCADDTGVRRRSV